MIDRLSVGGPITFSAGTLLADGTIGPVTDLTFSFAPSTLIWDPQQLYLLQASTMTVVASPTAALGPRGPITVRASGTYGAANEFTATDQRTLAFTVTDFCRLQFAPTKVLMLPQTTGGIASATVTVTASTILDFNEVAATAAPVALTVELPPGALGLSAGPQPPSVTPSAGNPATSVVSIQTSGSTPYGTHELKVKGTSGPLVTSGTVPVTLADFTLAVSPPTKPAMRGTTVEFDIVITRHGGFPGVISFLLVAPQQFNPPTVPNPGTLSKLSAFIPGNAAPGPIPFTVTGTSEGLTRTAQGTVNVQ